MLQGLVRRQSFRWIPFKTLLDEIREVRVFIANHQREGLPHRFPELASRVFHHDRFERYAVCTLVEEFVFARGHAEHSAVGHADHLDESGHLVVLAVSREDGVADIELGHDAPERPHVDCTVVRNAEHDLWSTVEPRLNVSVDPLVKEGRASEIDYLDA